jgi:hypothetical protein
LGVLFRISPYTYPHNFRIPAYQVGQHRTIEKEKALISQGFKDIIGLDKTIKWRRG